MICVENILVPLIFHFFSPFLFALFFGCFCTYRITHRFCFECFDVDGSGTIDEKEFVELCKYVNYIPLNTFLMNLSPPPCNNTTLTIIIPLIFYFILTNDHDRVINNASPIFPKNFKDALESFDVNEDGLIDYPEFLEMEKRYVYSLYFPSTPIPIDLVHTPSSLSIYFNPNLSSPNPTPTVIFTSFFISIFACVYFY